MRSAASRCRRRCQNRVRGWSPRRSGEFVDLVRKEQDLSKEINAQLGALNNAFASRRFAKTA